MELIFPRVIAIALLYSLGYVQARPIPLAFLAEAMVALIGAGIIQVLRFVTMLG